MKTLLACFVGLILCSMSAFAQSADVTAKPLTDEDIKLLRQDLQSAKDQIISHTMEFTTAEKAAFWPIYKEYSAEQHAIGDKRLHLVKEYVQNLDTMDDETAKSLTERMFKIADDTQALRKTYYPKFAQAIGAKRTAKFYQVDNRLTMMINLQLASEIPLIP